MSLPTSEKDRPRSPSPPAEPALAATAVVLRERPGLEVLLLERAKTMRFLPGAMVFPGGKVDQQDLEPSWHRLAWARGASQEHRDLGGLDLLALRMTAIRETFEESGLLIVRGNPPPHELLQRARALLAQGRDFQHATGELMDSLNPKALVPLTRWITPTHLPRRFDTLFFVVAAPPGQEQHVDGSENSRAVWCSPRDALLAFQQGRWPMVPPTRWTLQVLDTIDSIEHALEFAVRQTLLPVCPEYCIEKGKMVAVLPGHPGHTRDEPKLSGPLWFPGLG